MNTLATLDLSPSCPMTLTSPTLIHILLKFNGWPNWDICRNLTLDFQNPHHVGFLNGLADAGSCGVNELREAVWLFDLVRACGHLTIRFEDAP